MSRPTRQPAKPAKKSAAPQVATQELHLQVGLLDIRMQISYDDTVRLIRYWMLAGETVIFRCPHNRMEKNIVLRGGDSGAIAFRELTEDLKIKLAKYQMFRAADMMLEHLEREGV